MYVLDSMDHLLRYVCGDPCNDCALYWPLAALPDSNPHFVQV